MVNSRFCSATCGLNLEEVQICPTAIIPAEDEVVRPSTMVTILPSAQGPIPTNDSPGSIKDWIARLYDMARVRDTFALLQLVDRKIMDDATQEDAIECERQACITELKQLLIRREQLYETVQQTRADVYMAKCNYQIGRDHRLRLEAELRRLLLQENCAWNHVWDLDGEQSTLKEALDKVDGKINALKHIAGIAQDDGPRLPIVLETDSERVESGYVATD